jgi:putative ABC transport system permease protein
MLKSYIRIAWRNITRHKIFTFINVLGLSLGLCTCVVIYLITRFEYRSVGGYSLRRVWAPLVLPC